MIFNCFTKVTLFPLRTDNYDRRGTIASFRLKKVPNMEYIRYSGLQVLWTLTALLSSDFGVKDGDELINDYFSEGNDCWITPSHDAEDHVIRVHHKYWSESQIQCFIELIESLAQLHGWELERKCSE